MANISIVSINLVELGKDIKLLNESSYPILYYWNMDNDSEDFLIQFIINNPKVIHILNTQIDTLEKYSKASISYIYYSLNNNSENFIENTISIQDYISIDNIDNLIDKSLDEISKLIYLDIFNAEYSKQNDDPIVYDIFVKSNLINKNKISLDTFLNYIKSFTLKTYKLNQKNLDILIDAAARIIDKSQKYHEVF